MIPFRKIVLLSFLLCGCILGMNAKKREYMGFPFPKVWHRPDSVIINSSICDTIDLPQSYTMIMVYELFQPEISQQLWKITRTDNKYYSIGTQALTTETSTMPLQSIEKSFTPSIYTLYHTIRDTSYHDVAQLYFGADKDTIVSKIGLYEMAYFDYRLPLNQSLKFQTYLAIKYGITLDSVSYISTTGDTLWNAKASKKYYNRIQGFGTNMDYNFISMKSISIEDSTISIFSNDTLPANTYLLIGDNNADMSWQHYSNDTALLQRIWKMSAIGQFNDKTIQLKINVSSLQVDKSDTLFLTTLNLDHAISQVIQPDSIVNNFYYYTLSPIDGNCFTIGGDFEYKSSSINTSKKTRGKHKDDKQNDYIDVTFNPRNGCVVASIHFNKEKSINVIVQDVSGKTICHQYLTNIKDYQYQDKIIVSGVYLISFIDDKQDVIMTKEIIVY